uniref:Uncharacterized protein n=1 Tax=Sphaerodactylus townsendi TaxID=933632 RepID=A0ACB8FXY1_9SAUR
MFMSLFPLMCSILRTMEKIGFKMDFSGRNVTVILPRLALALMRPDPTSFQGIAFGVTSYEFPEIIILKNPFQSALASVFLPESLRGYLQAQSFDLEDHSEIQFSFFGSSALFENMTPVKCVFWDFRKNHSSQASLEGAFILVGSGHRLSPLLPLSLVGSSCPKQGLFQL